MSLVNDNNHGGKPPITIFVNTRAFSWAETDIAYMQVYDLAYPNEPLNDGDVARIEFSRGPHGGGAGSLQPGGSIRVTMNMIFDVYVTVRS